MQCRYLQSNIFQIFSIITPEETTTATEEMKLLSRPYLRNDLAAPGLKTITTLTPQLNPPRTLIAGESDEDECANDNIIID